METSVNRLCRPGLRTGPAKCMQYPSTCRKTLQTAPLHANCGFLRSKVLPAGCSPCFREPCIGAVLISRRPALAPGRQHMTGSRQRRLAAAADSGAAAIDVSSTETLLKMIEQTRRDEEDAKKKRELLLSQLATTVRGCSLAESAHSKVKPRYSLQ